VSNEAITWALNQKVGRSSAKFVLVAMANLASAGGMTCFPSIQYLSDATCQDRKTVVENLRRLRESGYIVDTGARKGSTGQVPVYRLNDTENGTVKSNDPENGTVPKTDSNSTVFPHKEARFSPLTGPKTGHGYLNTPKEPKGIPKKREQTEPFVLPAWVPVEAWNGYIEMRKKKKKSPTDHARDLVLKELAKFHAAGADLEAALNNSTRNGWTDVYAPKDPQQARASPTKQSRHSGFDKIDYSEGIENGRIT